MTNPDGTWDMTRKREGHPPEWATEEMETELGFRRFAYETASGGLWIARMEKMRTLLAGSPLGYKTLEYSYEHYDHYLAEYRKSEGLIMHGYLAPGMEFLNREESAWMYRVLSVARLRCRTPEDSVVDDAIKAASLHLELC